jgi:PAS domain S-box-containing protein
MALPFKGSCLLHPQGCEIDSVSGLRYRPRSLRRVRARIIPAFGTLCDCPIAFHPNVLFAVLNAAIVALIAAGLSGVIAVGLMYLRSERRVGAPEPADPQGTDAAKLENLQLILDTLERSNVLLWWSRVTREGSKFDWKIRTPPQLRNNPIFRLASLIPKGWLWKDEQSPDRERMNETSGRAFAEGASGYQQEFRIIGSDGVHWLSEEVVIRPVGPNEWNLAGVIIDVTKRHEVEAKYRGIFENAREGILLTKPDGTILAANPALARIFGYESADTFMREVPNMTSVHVDDARRVEMQRQLQESGNVVGFEIQMRCKDGTPIWVLANVQVVHDKQGEEHYEGTLEDVTARKRAEEDLRREEGLFRELANAIPDHIYFKDRQSRFIRINLAMARSFGLRDAAEAVGKTDFDVFGSEHARQAYADEQRIMETGEPMIGVEEKETWPDGRVTWVSTTKVPLRDAQGAITGMVGVSRDITLGKLADAQLREQNEILSRSHEGVMIVNLANEVLLWNRGAEEIFGWTSAEALGQPPDKLLGVDDPDTVSTLRAAVERDGFWNGELRVKTRDGRSLIVSNRITQVQDETGRPRARLNFLVDITEKKLLEEKFLHAQRLETIGMLATGIAHDLNNVLSPIMFAAPMLRESLSSPRDLKILETLKQCAARGAGLVKQILGFAHSAAGEQRPTQLKHIAREVIGVIEETFPRSIVLDQSIPSDLMQVQGNATQIHQVLLNLCVNARDAMPQGGTLTISAANRHLDAMAARAISGARPGDWLVIEVGDTGTGIPPDVLERIWTPFFTTKGAGKGTGLGLSTVRGIVLNHHGFMELHTKVGRGTTFRVYLPAIEGDSTQRISASPFEIPDGNGELILLVDDDAPIRETGAAILEKHGYRVVSCVDGVEALIQFLARAADISLVITDVDMPRIGGAELARTLSEIRPDVPVLAISGLSQSEADGSGVSAAKKATRAFLPKPFMAADLLVAVNRLIHPP